MDTRRTIGNGPGKSGAVGSRSSLPRRLRETVSVLLVGLSLSTIAVHAQDATWLPAPGSGNWNTGANWLPATIPTGTASFFASSTTTITFSPGITTVGALEFNPLAPAYTFNLTGVGLVINGTGIVNNSSNAPTFANAGVRTSLSFNGSSTAGNATIIAITGALVTNFNQSSTAGNATIFDRNGSNVVFADTSKAGNATIFTDSGSFVFFKAGSTGGQARLITDAGGTVDLSLLTSPG